MNISEKSIEDVIFDCLATGKKSKLVDRGLLTIDNYELFFRQTDLGSYGRSDLIGLSYRKYDNWDLASRKCFQIGVIEIKKGVIDYSAFIQSVRYCKAIARLLEDYDMVAKFKVILIGTEICKSDFCYLPDFMSELEVYKVALDLDKGIIFKKQKGFFQANEKDFNISPDIPNEIRNYLKETIRCNVFNDVDPF